MFWHNFKYTLRIILRDHALVFWTFAFPLIMATFFNLAFSNIEKSEQLDVIKIAVVENENWREEVGFREAMESLSDPENPERMFDTTYLTREEAREKLEQEEIVGYVELLKEAGNNWCEGTQCDEVRPQVTIGQNGINATILKTVVERIAQQSSLIEKIMREDPSKLNDLLNLPEMELADGSSEHLSYTVIEYYTLIAMTCLYGGIIGMVAINQLLANMSASGKRIEMSPVPKWKLVLGGLLASYLIQLAGLGLLFGYTVLVLGVDYGSRWGLVVLIALLGSLAGLTLGIMLAAVVKTNEATKTGIMIAVAMFGCMLAGMMGITMKYLVDANFPVLNQVNPANLITDGLYALYYYDGLERFWGDVIILAVLVVATTSISVMSLRKAQYDSI